jgi:hypothetical protein
LRVVACVVHYFFLIRQASLPACALEQLIRIAGIGTAMRWTGASFALAPRGFIV